MTDQQHPITPPQDKVYKWWEEACKRPPSSFYEKLDYVAEQAARWGSNQELQACCEWAAEQDRGFDLELRAARRPKPPSWKEQALEALDRMDQLPTAEDQHIIRRALEQLDD